MIKDISHKIPTYSDILYDVFSFVGGMNARASDLFLGRDGRFSVQKDQTRELVNLLRTQSGGLVSRPGRVKLNSTPLAPAAGDQTVRSIFELSTPTTSVIVVNAGNEIFKWTGSNFVSVGTTPTPNRRMLWCQFKDKALGINGADSMVSFDGTNLSIISQAPSDGVAIASHRNRVWVLRGRSLSYCALGDETDWTSPNNAGFLPVPVTKGRSGTALISLWDRLLVFTQDQVFQLYGTSPNDFEILPVNLQYGHQGSPHSVLSAGNDVYYVNSRGVNSLGVTQARSVTGDVSYDYASGMIEPIWQTINKSNLENIVGVHDSSRNLLILLCSRTGPTNTEAFVADYYHLDPTGQPTWSMYSNMPFASAAEVFGLSGVPDILFGGYDGYVYVQKEDSDDAGANIPFVVEYVTDLDVPTFSKTWRHLVIFASAVNTKITGSVTFDFSQTCPFSVDINTVSGDVIGSTFTIGVSALGSASVQPFRVAIPGHGRLVNIKLSGSNSNRLFIGGFLIYAGVRRLIHN